MRALIALTAACAGLFATARAAPPHATTQPAATVAEAPLAALPSPSTPLAPSSDEAKWTVSVQILAGVLNGTLEPTELRKAVAGHAWMAPFERNRSESALLIAGRLPTRNVVCVRSYLHPSVSAASDLFADLSANGAIAPSILKQLTPPEGRDLRQADATMARWFASALDVQEGEPVALIALYADGQQSNASPQLHFILVRGEFASDGVPRATRVLYGTLDTATR